MVPERVDPVPAIVGWRSWRYEPVTNRLLSCVWGTVWPVGERLAAVHVGQHPSYELEFVTANTTMGVHAWKTSADLDRIIKFDEGLVTVWGEVSLWGRVVEHTLGWRAEFAYPLSLLLLPNDRAHAPRIASTYGVEARVMEPAAISPHFEQACRMIVNDDPQ